MFVKATYYGLDCPGSESRGGENFRNRPGLPWGPSSLLCNGYWVCFPGIKRPGRGVNYPPPSRAEFKQTVELYRYFLSGRVLGRNLSLLLCEKWKTYKSLVTLFSAASCCFFVWDQNIFLSALFSNTFSLYKFLIGIGNRFSESEDQEFLLG